MELHLISAAGESQVIARVSSQAELEELCRKLREARKAFFHRKGKINYTNLEATCDGCVIRFAK